MKTKLEQALESGTIQFPRGLTGEERRAFIKEKLVDSVEETRRKLFESSINIRTRTRNEHGEYVLGEIRDMWSGFNAALDLLVIEFISEHSISASDDPWSVRDWCISDIESLNLGIKIK